MIFNNTVCLTKSVTLTGSQIKSLVSNPSNTREVGVLLEENAFEEGYQLIAASSHVTVADTSGQFTSIILSNGNDDNDFTRRQMGSIGLGTIGFNNDPGINILPIQTGYLNLYMDVSSSASINGIDDLCSVTFTIFFMADSSTNPNFETFTGNSNIAEVGTLTSGSIPASLITDLPVQELVTNLSANTTNATPALLGTVNVPNNSSITCTINVNCAKTSGSGLGSVGVSGVFRKLVTVQNLGGTLSIIGSVTNLVADILDLLLAPSISITINNTTKNIEIHGTGAANDNVSWYGMVQSVTNVW